MENQSNILDTAALAKIARADFYFYCQILKPRFYLPSRPHLKILCKTLQDFHENKIIGKDGKPIKKLMLNLGPRHGKTLTVDMFSQWILGHDRHTSIIRACYNETLSGRSAKTVRDGIQEIKVGKRIVYSDIFPESKIKYGDASYQLWSLEDSPFSFLATSPTGTMTGVGCKWGILDDLIRDAKEAYNDRILEDHWDFYNNTYSSRLESGAKEIVIMTRWSVNDLCGKLLATAPDDWYVIKMPAYNDGKMLCDDILDLETYNKRKNSPGTDAAIFSANYDQETMEAKDKLYGTFKTYDETQEKYEKIEAYIDTADEGSDYLAGVVVGVHKGLADVLDLIYTQDAMEKTEPSTARMLTNTNCHRAVIEANNGGKGFSRSVSNILRDELHNSKTTVEWFHQGENKMARILSNATSVTNCIRFPAQWREMWPQVYRELSSASRTRKMVHDDIEDALTGIVEKILGVNTKYEVW